jgi:radical SAM superfamily enzyme YgiQ (UPF0313 family)
MKIALVYPEVYDLARFKEQRKEFPPFGILYLASFLEENHFEVSIFKISQGQTQHDFSGYDVIGFSIPSSATYDIVKKSRFTSLYHAKATIAVGGVHPSFYPEQTLIDFQADVVAIGSGEKTLLDIVRSHTTKDFSRIAGICYQKDATIITNPTRPLENSIDWIPLPARHLLPESDFIMNTRLAGTGLRMTHIMLSRGCPFSCHFCAVGQKKVQYRSGKNVRLELEYLQREYRIDGFAVVDDNFVVNKNMIRNVCESIDDLKLPWSALSRVDTVDYELLETMHHAGCIEIKFGVESGSEKMLRAMGKNISINQIRQAITLATAIGIHVKIFLVHGFPGETLASTRETISLLEDIHPMVDRVSLFRFAPLPGSYVFQNPKIFNLHLPEKISDWGKFHIYHNQYHWWGSQQDFQEVELSYQQLNNFVIEHWP